jgi:hypothetical protein
MQIKYVQEQPLFLDEIFESKITHDKEILSSFYAVFSNVKAIFCPSGKWGPNQLGFREV